MKADEPLSEAEIVALARAAGLRLAPEHLGELLHAHQRLQAILLRMPRGRPWSQEPAHVFDPRRYLIATEKETSRC